MKDLPPVKLGLIGCGGFGRFCINAVVRMSEAELVAIVDSDSNLLEKTAKEFNLRGFKDPAHLSQMPDIEMVHIVTPPDTHFPLAHSFLEKDKHVLCEKPLALSIKDAVHLIDIAAKMQKIIPVNFVLRYTPIVDMVKEIIEMDLLGKPIRAYFENYATDESLNPDHWFWDKTKSGGIFVEHGVHFFDLYHYWFGELDVVWAIGYQRPDTGQEDRVMAILNSKSGVLVHHYHGFDQPAVLDRQIHRIICEQGEIIIEGWIPVSLKIDALVSNPQADKLHQIFPDSDISFMNNGKMTNQIYKARGRTIKASKRIKIEYHSPISKLNLYTEAIQRLLIDQITYLRNSEHQRVVTEQNGLTALKYAIKAQKFNKN